MAFPHTHKTVIVLDRSPYFLNNSSQYVDFDIFTKNRAQGFIPLAPVPKTLWTCNVEAAVEYSRIVYDIFPAKKLIQLITSDCEAHVLNSWSQHEQNLPQLMTVLAKHGAPDPRLFNASDCSVVHGLVQAVEVLCHPTEVQNQIRSKYSTEESLVPNKGRIICLTSLPSDSYVATLEQCVQDAVIEHNKLAAATDTLLPLTHCDLVLIHVVPIGEESNISHKASREISALMSAEVHVSQSGRHIAIKMVELVMKQFGLGSTTVTGIPMKEEQNASSSANYDVELLHPAEAHSEFFPTAHAEGMIIPSKEGLNTPTVTLKWCTPKSNAMGELQQCTSVYRMTPVDVNSRPSSCLTNFLLNGRAVMLEQPRKTLPRTISHILASHGGEIFIHTLAVARSILEDPPSISEGCGGRVTDYRITNFGELMKLARVAPMSDPSHLPETPIQRQKAKVNRLTRYWPIVISDTIIFNMTSHLDPLLSLIVKESLTEDEVLECKKVIYHVVGMESRNESLPVATSGVRGKGPKRDEQYRQMWSELEKFVEAHANNSPNHVKILECLLECKRPPEESRMASPPFKKSTENGRSLVKDEKPDRSELERSLQDFEKFQRMTEREKKEMNKPDLKISDLSPATKKLKLSWDLNKQGGGQSLLSLWSNRINTVNSQKRKEFAGRLQSTSNKVELYAHMKEDNANNQSEVTSITHKK